MPSDAHGSPEGPKAVGRSWVAGAYRGSRRLVRTSRGRGDGKPGQGLASGLICAIGRRYPFFDAPSRPVPRRGHRDGGASLYDVRGGSEPEPEGLRSERARAGPRHPAPARGRPGAALDHRPRPLLLPARDDRLPHRLPRRVAALAVARVGDRRRDAGLAPVRLQEADGRGAQGDERGGLRRRHRRALERLDQGPRVRSRSGREQRPRLEGQPDHPRQGRRFRRQARQVRRRQGRSDKGGGDSTPPKKKKPAGDEG